MEDFFMICIENRQIVIHTSNHVYRESLVKQLNRILQRLGFLQANKSNFLDPSKIVEYDKKKRIAYMDSDKKVYCVISRNHKEKFENI